MGTLHDGRYAPSPTGRLHLGNLRTALLAWLAARSRDARFVLRIDDLDPGRARPQHERQQIADLQSLGIEWDGAPVRQSERLQRYTEALAQLERDGRTYPCFCTRAEVLAAATAPHGSGPDAPYPGTCATLSGAAARRRIESGDPWCMRARAMNESIAFHDELIGPVKAAVDDFVVRRRDGVAAYNLASPIDESDLAIGTVVRGADLATTTTRQLWVARMLGLHVPRFAHVALVVGDDGDRLAKRDGADSLAALAERGLDATGVLQLLARSLGSATPIEPARVSAAADLIDGFDLARVPRTPWRIELGSGPEPDPR
jgi:glutamyl-tRNA synthetase